MDKRLFNEMLKILNTEKILAGAPLKVRGERSSQARLGAGSLSSMRDSLGIERIGAPMRSIPSELGEVNIFPIF